MVGPFTNSRIRVSMLSFAIVAVAAFLFAAPMGAWAQSTTSGSVGGSVVDPSNAVIVGAKITMQQHGTNLVLSAKTDATGRYSFPVVAPGDYTITVTQAGFQTSVVTTAHVEVATAATVNFTLKVGQQSQTVEVTSIPGAELQTTNASIGTTMGSQMIENLPSIQRNVTSLLGLQPAVTPMTTSDVMGGQVAGAASDQTTFIVDGGDATSDMEGTNSYAGIPGEAEPAPFVFVGVESTSEFRVVSAGPTSNENRSQGGNISIVTKSGTNSLHGSGYEYYEGSHFFANSWSRNRQGRNSSGNEIAPRPNTVNNRFGATLGGPFLKNKFWFYGNYEGRRYRQSATINTDVPTASARNGILTFLDGNGNPTQYNFNPANGPLAAVCGPAGNLPCDPRGIGIDPLIQQYWGLEPSPNNPGTGDHCVLPFGGNPTGGCLNSQGFQTTYAEPDNENYGLIRLDYKINDRWTLFGTYRQQKYLYNTSDQFDISGSPKLLSGTPVLPRFATFGLTGAIGSSFTNEVHGDYMLDSWGWLRSPVVNPSAISGLGGVLQVSGEGRTGSAGSGKPFADPVNFNTQNGRARAWDGRDWYLADDATWLHGNHNISFGGSWYYWNIIHQRTDDVLGGLTGGTIYWVGSSQMSSGLWINKGGNNSERPPTCGGAIMTNCLNSTDINRWYTMYGSMLGLVDHTSQVATTNAQFQLNPLGTPAIDHVHMGSFYLYTGDEWHIRPTTTLTYGVSWGVQMPPREVNGLQVLQQYAATGQPVENLPAYFTARQAALDRGDPYPSMNEFNNVALQTGCPTGVSPCIPGGPSFEFSPIGAVPGKTRPINTAWGSVGPHIALAWQPPWQNRFFGDNHNTVVRLGYSLEWNRTNAVGMVLTPLLGDGLMQIVGCRAPDSTGTCTGATTTAANAFRIGSAEDGTTLPPPQGVPGYPLVPSSPFASPEGFNIDPAVKPAWSNNVNFDIQRSFSHNWLVDVGYIGRWVNDLLAGGDINASDMFAKDPVSGQTLAQAFSAVEKWANAGGSCSSATNCGTLAVQPFFEDMAVPGGSPTAGPAFCQATYGGPCTFQAAQDTGDAFNGDLGSFMEFNYNSIAAAPLDPMQFEFNFWNFTTGWSNYNAGFVTVKKALSQGLNLQFSYTYSHSIGTQTLNQQYIIYGNPSPFDPGTGYTEEPYDTRHVFNLAAYYQLPFGKGQRFASGNNIVDRVIGGWWASGIWTWQSGQPVCISADGDYGDIAGGSTVGDCAVSTMSPTQLKSLLGVHKRGGQEFMFANAGAVLASLSHPDPTTNLRPFAFNFSGFPLWNLDMSVGKNLLQTERVKALFTADFFNAFNAFMPGTPGMDIGDDPTTSGEITGQANSPRVIQFGLHLTF